MIYQLRFDSGDTYVGSSFSKLGAEPPALRSAKQLHNIVEKVELEECTEENAEARLAHWIEALQPTITWNVGTYSNPEITEVINLFLNTDMSLKEISNETGVNYDTVKKVLQGKLHKEATKGLNLADIKKSRKKVFKVYSIDKEYEYEVAGMFELKHSLKPGFMSRLKKSGFELPLEKFSFKPYDPRVYKFRSDEGLTFDMGKKEAFRVLTECGLSKNKIQHIFDGRKEQGWEIVHNIAASNWFPS